MRPADAQKEHQPIKEIIIIIIIIIIIKFTHALTTVEKARRKALRANNGLQSIEG